MPQREVATLPSVEMAAERDLAEAKHAEEQWRSVATIYLSLLRSSKSQLCTPVSTMSLSLINAALDQEQDHASSITQITFSPNLAQAL